MSGARRDGKTAVLGHRACGREGGRWWRASVLGVGLGSQRLGLGPVMRVWILPGSSDVVHSLRTEDAGNNWSKRDREEKGTLTAHNHLFRVVLGQLCCVLSLC